MLKFAISMLIFQNIIFGAAFEEEESLTWETRTAIHKLSNDFNEVLKSTTLINFENFSDLRDNLVNQGKLSLELTEISLSRLNIIKTELESEVDTIGITLGEYTANLALSSSQDMESQTELVMWLSQTDSRHEPTIEAARWYAYQIENRHDLLMTIVHQIDSYQKAQIINPTLEDILNYIREQRAEPLSRLLDSSETLSKIENFIKQTYFPDLLEEPVTQILQASAAEVAIDTNPPQNTELEQEDPLEYEEPPTEETPSQEPPMERAPEQRPSRAAPLN